MNSNDRLKTLFRTVNRLTLLLGLSVCIAACVEDITPPTSQTAQLAQQGNPSQNEASQSAPAADSLPVEVPVSSPSPSDTTTPTPTSTNEPVRSNSPSLSNAPTTDATLSSLTLNDKSLEPALAVKSGIINYTGFISYETNTFTLTPTPSQPDAAVTIEGVNTPSGSASKSYPAKIGSNTFRIVVTAQDGQTTQTYQVTVIRANSNDATLLSLTANDLELSPPFSPEIERYKGIAKNLNDVTITPTVSDGHAVVAINGTHVTSGTESKPIKLSGGVAKIEIQVNARDDSTKIYNLEILSNLGRVFTLAGKRHKENPPIRYQNGTGTAARFWKPTGIAVTPQGNFYVADSANHRIRKITREGIVTTLAGSGLPGNINGTGESASFNHPSGIAIDRDENVFVGDTGNHLVRKITPDGAVTTLAGSGESKSENGTGTKASFFEPRYLAVDSNQNIYVSDTQRNTIRKISKLGIVTTFAGSSFQGNMNAKGTYASFNRPQGLAIDISGNIYVVDQGSQMVRKIAPSGDVTTLKISNGKLIKPTGIATDLSNGIYITDTDKHFIQKITLDGTLTTIAGSGTAGFKKEAGTEARFSSPTGIAVNSIGELFIADTENNLIRLIK